MEKFVFGTLLLFVSTFLSSQNVTTIASIEGSFGDGMLVTATGDILIAGGYNKSKILKVTTKGVVSTFVDGLPGPVGMAFDSAGNFYVSNYTGNSITKIAPNLTKTVFASGLDGPSGLVISKDKLYVSLYGKNFSGQGKKVLRFDLNGAQEDYIIGNGISDAIGITFDNNANAYITNFEGGNIFKVSPDKSVQVLAKIPSCQINQITYGNGQVYVPCQNLRKIYTIDVETGTVKHLAGSGQNNTLDGPLLDAGFNLPNSCAINTSADTLYILDGTIGKIRALSISAVSKTNDLTDFNQYFKISANPFSQSLDIFSLKDAINTYDLKIINLAGSIIYGKAKSETNSVYSISVDTSNWIAGLYFIQISKLNKNYITKILKE